jgi:hypothetical protein
MLLWFQCFELARQSIPRLAAVLEWAPISKLVSHQTMIVIIIIILENEKYLHENAHQLRVFLSNELE